MTIKPPKNLPQRFKEDLGPITEGDRQEAKEKMEEARFGLVIHHPFYAIIASRLPFVEIADKDHPIKTGATDFKNIYYNVDFIRRLNHGEVQFLICHEINHCVFEHFISQENRDKDYWNMACDYVINYIQDRDKIGQFIEIGLLDRKYADWTSEDVYDDLERNQAEKQDTLDVHIEVVDDDGDEDGDGQGQDGDEDGDGKPKSGNGDSKDGDGKVPGKIQIKKSDLKKIRDQIRQTTIQAAKSAGQGNTPAEIQRMIDEFLNPKVVWNDLIEAVIASNENFDSSFCYPDRKSWSNGMGAILPGGIPDYQISVAIGIDNSGSIDNGQLKEFLSEVRGIMENYSKFNIVVWCFDTQVSGVQVYDQDNADELIDYKFTGGGGTHIKSNWDFMKSHEDELPEFDTFICFTDLYDSGLEKIDPHYIDTVWIINGNDAEPPFGKFAQYHRLGND